MITHDRITMDDPPAIAGLVFRPFRGPADFPAMVPLINRCNAAIGEEWVETEDSLTREYAHLSDSDPYRDMVLAEVEGQLVGYSRGWWYEEQDGPLLYGAVVFLDPDWQGRGIGRGMVRWMESRQREIAAAHAPERSKYFQRYVTDKDHWQTSLLVSEGYRPERYTFQMVRPTLDDIPDFPLPDGLELRPVRPEHYRLIWDADYEAFQDHWGYSPPTEERYQAWLANETIFQPDLWQIAWDVATNEIAGQVRTFIDWVANRKHNHARGYTEFISVRRPWRRRGLARALIAESLRVQRARGMTSSALGVDTENLSGATRVYEDCGFRVESTSTIYRKPL